MDEKLFAVYIITNPRHTVLYVGVTNNLVRRITEHRSGTVDGFAKKYNCRKLVFFEVTTDAYSAISREKEIKGWSRLKKEAIVTMQNPTWLDLYPEILG